MGLFKKQKKSESCDVLLQYEIKSREIENLCLLKYELEKRGYSVKIIMQIESFFFYHPPIDAKLVVVPEYYGKRMQHYIASHTFTTEKILNMMWEQVFNSNEENNKDTIHAIVDWARDASHIAWGTNMRDRQIYEWGCDPSHVFMTGHLTLDFLRMPLISYYDSKENLFTEFGIPMDKKAHLFISSLAYADADIRLLRSSNVEKNDENLMKYKKLCADTRKEILTWFEKILDMDEDSVIIYRPHPEEKGNDALYELAKRQNRFFIIRDKSVKQWIIACDKIYTWMSTSITEIIASGKDFNVLRPIMIPQKYDIKMFSEIEHISTFDEFQEDYFSNTHQDKSAIINSLKKYYYIPQEKFTYELVCDAIEQILKDDEYKIVPPLENDLLRWYYPERIKNVIKRMVAHSKLCQAISKSNLWKSTKFRELIDDIFYIKDKIKRNATSEEEISEIMEKIEKALS